MSRGLLWNWWQQVRTGVLSPEAMPVFMPVQVTREAAPERAPLALRGPGPGNSVEVSLGFLAVARQHWWPVVLPHLECSRSLTRCLT